MADDFFLFQTEEVKNEASKETDVKKLKFQIGIFRRLMFIALLGDDFWFQI